MTLPYLNTPSEILPEPRSCAFDAYSHISRVTLSHQPDLAEPSHDTALRRRRFLAREKANKARQINRSNGVCSVCHIHFLAVSALESLCPSNSAFASSSIAISCSSTCAEKLWTCCRGYFRDHSASRPTILSSLRHNAHGLASYPPASRSCSRSVKGVAKGTTSGCTRPDGAWLPSFGIWISSIISFGLLWLILLTPHRSSDPCRYAKYSSGWMSVCGIAW